MSSLSNKALWVLRQMVKHPGEVRVLEFFPYRKGIVRTRYNEEKHGYEESTTIVEYSGSDFCYGGRLKASPSFASKINRMENIMLGSHRDNHICMTVLFRGRVHAMRFSDWGCTLVLDARAEPKPRSY
jgi:hypothetical protein